MTNNNPAHIRYMTPQQLQKMRLVLFTKAAASMGARIEQLEADKPTDYEQFTQAIRSEWVVDD